MFARKKAEAVPESRPGDIPSLRSFSQTYALLLARSAELSQRSDALRAEFLTTSDRENQLRIEQELVAIKREQQDIASKIRHETTEASVAICQRVAPHHQALVAKLATAAIALHQANVEYSDFASKLERRGIRWSRLKPAFPAFIGAPRDKGSPLAMFLKQLVIDGFLDRDALPKEFGGKR